MKCLVIANSIGVTAPGIVNETIIRELSKNVDISLFAIQKHNEVNLDVNVLPTVAIGFQHLRIEKMLFSLFYRNLLDDFWLLRQKRIIDANVIEEHDIIISLISNLNYKSLLLGAYLSRKFRKKWIIYSVDAIPAPIGWVKDSCSYRNTRKFINKYLLKCDAFFSANQQMLDYQLSSLKDFVGLSGVLYTPIRSDFSVEVIDMNQTPTFLYTGGIYGPRRIDALLAGFELYLKEEPTARLVFVGVDFSYFTNKYRSLINSGNIKIYGYTSNLLPFYNSASVLIDVNAYFENDVFLSSKIVNYLTVKKPIISITGFNSPSRNIFTNDSSIVHCFHDASEICNALRVAYNYKNDDWKERDKYIEKFTAKNVIKELLKVSAKLIDSYK